MPEADRGALTPPPRRILPAALVGDYLPAQWRRLTDGQPLRWPPWDDSACLEVDGSPHALRLAAGVLSGSPGPARAPVWTLTCDRAAFDGGIVRGLGALVAAPWAQLPALRAALAAAVGRADRAPLEACLRLPGTLEVAYTDDAGDVLRYTLQLAGAGAGTPRAQVALGEADVRALAALRPGGSLAPLLAQRLVLGGDVAWLLQLGAAVAGFL